MPRQLQNLITHRNHLGILLGLQQTKRAVHQCRNFLVIGILVNFACAEKWENILKDLFCFHVLALVQPIYCNSLLSSCLRDFLVKFHIEAIFSLTEVVKPNHQKNDLRKLLIPDQFTVIHIVVSVSKQSFISAFDFCYLCWLHPLYGISKHMRDWIIIEIAFTASQLVQFA